MILPISASQVAGITRASHNAKPQDSYLKVMVLVIKRKRKWWEVEQVWGQHLLLPLSG
jgi:hypothetical protein